MTQELAKQLFHSGMYSQTVFTSTQSFGTVNLAVNQV